MHEIIILIYIKLPYSRGDNSRYPLIGTRVNLRAGLDILKQRKLFLSRELNCKHVRRAEIKNGGAVPLFSHTP
jgi:hypothetical protein